MPLLNGMTMSMVVRSGLSSLYFSTASRPLAASPTTSKPDAGEDVLDHVPHEDRVVDDQDSLRHGLRVLPGRVKVAPLVRSDKAREAGRTRLRPDQAPPPKSAAAAAASGSTAQQGDRPGPRRWPRPATSRRPPPASAGASDSTPSTAADEQPEGPLVPVEDQHLPAAGRAAAAAAARPARPGRPPPPPGRAGS